MKELDLNIKEDITWYSDLYLVWKMPDTWSNIESWAYPTCCVLHEKFVTTRNRWTRKSRCFLRDVFTNSL